MAEEAVNSARDATPVPGTGRRGDDGGDLDGAWRLAYVVSGDQEAATTATTRAFAEATTADRRPPSRTDLLAATVRRTLSQAAQSRPLGPVVAPGSGVTSALWELPAPQRAALWLTEMGDLNDDELAEVLGLTADKVEHVATRAARWLDVALDHQSGPLCQHEPKLADYIDGNLPLVEAVEIDDHLSGCPTCTAKVKACEELADLPAVLAKAVPEPPDDLLAQMAQPPDGVAPLGRSDKSTGPRPRPKAVRPLAACCVALLAVGLLGLIVLRTDQRTGRPAGATTNTSIRLPPVAGVTSVGGADLGVPVPPETGGTATTSTTAQTVTFPTLPTGGPRTTHR